MSTTSTALGARIQYHRRARGMTRAQLAVAAGVAFETIGRAERGAGSPRLEHIKAIANALGVDFVALLEEAS